jgi:hypothetical protein
VDSARISGSHGNRDLYRRETSYLFTIGALELKDKEDDLAQL